MSLVSSSVAIWPPPSKATLNLRGRPVSERSLRTWKCHSRASGRVSVELLRIDARRRAAGDVANVVGAGAARAQAEVLHRFDDRRRIGRRDLAHLDVGARRHMGVAAAVALGEIGHAGELRMRQDAVGDAQPHHVALLRRRDVEQAEIAPAEIVVGLGKRAGLGLRPEAGIGVEGMFGALPLFLVRQLAAPGDGRILRGEWAASGPVGAACATRAPVSAPRIASMPETKPSR